MAELFLRLGDNQYGVDSHFNDGDIVAAFSNRRIGYANIETLCSEYQSLYTPSGTRVSNSPIDTYLSKIYQYKFTRVSRTQVLREELVTGAHELVGAAINENGIAMDVPVRISNLKASNSKLIFGENGAEYWYGGRQNKTLSNLIQVWDAMENSLQISRVDYQKYPTQARELKVWLIVGVQDFDLPMESRLVSEEKSWLQGMPQFNSAVDPEINYKRRSTVDWRSLNVASESDILNPDTTVDVRDADFLITDIVQYKQRKTIWTDQEREIANGNNN